jgi:hypothetical protein
MRNGGRVLLAVLNFYERIKIRVTTFDTNHSVTYSTQSIASSIQKFTDNVVKSHNKYRHRDGRRVRTNGQVIDQFEFSR